MSSIRMRARRRVRDLSDPMRRERLRRNCALYGLPAALRAPIERQASDGDAAPASNEE